MRREAEVELGERKYTIKELPMKQNARWRKSLAEPFGEIAELLSSVGGVEVNPQELGGLIERVKVIALGSVDMLAGLIFDYSPELRADRKRIENEAFDSELFAAFTKILGLAYPFGQALSLITKLTETGLADKPTSTS